MIMVLIHSGNGPNDILAQTYSLLKLIASRLASIERNFSNLNYFDDRKVDLSSHTLEI